MGAEIMLNMGKFRQHLACVLQYTVYRRWKVGSTSIRKYSI